MIFDKEKKIKVDNNELSFLINCLNDMRNKMIKNDGDVDYVNRLLLKYIAILEK